MINVLLMLIVLLNFLILGESRIATVIRSAAVQGVCFGLITVISHSEFDVGMLIVGSLSVLMKGLMIPYLLFRAIREVNIRKEVEPMLGFIPSLLLGATGTGLAMLFAVNMPVDVDPHLRFVIPASFSTILTGFLILTTRLKAIMQVVGYLILENGILLFGLLLFEAMPILIEMGGLLDLFVGVFVMGIILNQIQRAYSSLDTTHLTTLKE